ncbi:VOC family protein [Neorhizobium sp. IRS_2294]|uniref:VOC family protein n=1 Tax=unclassified Neorhizobium TaxID=2629175 RepID=UPI003D2CE1E6
MASPDHIIALVNDVEKAAADYAALGFTILERQDSQHGSAVYRFICLDDGSYILITAFTDAEALKKHRLGPLLAAGEGWGDYSFTVVSVDALSKELEAMGSKTAGPVDVGNTLADGSKWGLKLLMTGRGTGGDDALPFVVEDVVGRGYRIPAAVPHANGATGIARMIIASPMAEATAKVLAAQMAAPMQAAEAYQGRQAFSIAAGTYSVTVFQDDAASPIGRIGGGLYAVELKGSEAKGALDLTLAHGALLSIVKG